MNAKLKKASAICRWCADGEVPERVAESHFPNLEAALASTKADQIEATTGRWDWCHRLDLSGVVDINGVTVPDRRGFVRCEAHDVWEADHRPN